MIEWLQSNYFPLKALNWKCIETVNVSDFECLLPVLGEEQVRNQNNAPHIYW